MKILKKIIFLKFFKKEIPRKMIVSLRAANQITAFSIIHLV